ncbi:PAS domain-containing protein [Streptomyces sp. NPDC001380]|uniref:ATP-binding SpoIIE family protein phosphatase n=1 Tax=Streptomyces sp. NPDC001380 TaxID=3364566 RepID=UPI0036D0BF92
MAAIGTTSPQPSPRGLPATARMVIDRYGVISDWSAEAQGLLGYPASEMVGKTADAVLVRQGAAYPKGGAPGGHGAQAPVVLRCRDGSSRACQVRIRPVGGTPNGWEVSFTPLPEASEALDLDGAVLDALFTRSPMSLCVYGTDLRLLRFNPAAEGMQGVFGRGSLGRTPHELWPDSNSDVFEDGMRKVLETGVALIGFEKRGRPPGDPGHEHIFANSVFRLENSEGRILGLATTAVETTKQRVAEERIELLAEASSVIGTSLDVLETSQQLAAVAVPRLADAAAVDLFSPVISGEDPAPDPGDLLRAGVLHAGGSSEQLSHDQPGLPYPAAVGALVEKPEPRREIVDLPVRDEPLHRETRGTRRAHLLVVPVAARGTVLGFVSLYRLGLENPFSDFDVLTARDLASRAALGIDNARRYTREHSAARTLQRDLSRLDVSGQSAVETAHYFAPDSSSAAWLDVIPISGARIALVLGTTDESGLRGAAAVGRLGAAVHALADLDLSPEEVLARLDTLANVISGVRPFSSEERHGGVGADLRCVYAVYDPTTGKIIVASAGQIYPVVAHPDGRVFPFTAPIGPPLGTTGSRPGAVELDLETDSTLVFLPEQGGVSSTAPGSLIRVLSSARAAPLQELRKRILDETFDPSRGGGAVLLLARTRRLDENSLSEWDLPSDPAVVATARSLVHQQLSVWGLEEAAFVTELVVSELVTNAVRYADGPIGLRLIRDHRALTCEVSDKSSTAPHLRYARSSDEGGRGLFLVAELTQRWGTRFSDSGKTIWTEQDLDELTVG